MIFCSTLKNTETSALPLKECGKLYHVKFSRVPTAPCLDIERYPKQPMCWVTAVNPAVLCSPARVTASAHGALLIFCLPYTALDI